MASWPILVDQLQMTYLTKRLKQTLRKQKCRNLPERLKNRPQRTKKYFPRTHNQNYVPDNGFNARKRQIAQRMKNKSMSFLGSKARPGERHYKAQTAPARRQQVVNYKPTTLEVRSGGRISDHLAAWADITQDPHI